MKAKARHEFEIEFAEALYAPGKIWSYASKIALGRMMRRWFSQTNNFFAFVVLISNCGRFSECGTLFYFRIGCHGDTLLSQSHLFYRMAIKFTVDFLLFPTYVVNRFRFHGFRFLPISGFRNRWFINSHRPRIIFCDDEIEKCVEKFLIGRFTTTYAPSLCTQFSLPLKYIKKWIL